MPVCPSSLAIRIAAQVFRLPSAGWESMRAEKVEMAEVVRVSRTWLPALRAFFSAFRTWIPFDGPIAFPIGRGAADWCAHRAVRTVAGTPGRCFRCAHRAERTNGTSRTTDK
jgi:hypothetical protein